MGFPPVVYAVFDEQDGVMGEIVNLRRARKLRERDEATVAAQRNRVRHGRAKVEKANDKRVEERRQALLDASLRGETGE
jgi:uncharacterized protein DUF4169